MIQASPDQQALAQKLIAELDRPHKAYRLTFTLADSDGGKRVGIQHFSIIVVAGQRTILKQGSKIPVMTGSYDTKTNSQQTQFTYIDIGMNFDVTISDSPAGLLLKAKVEDSSVGSPNEYGNTSGPLAQEPIVHQTSLEGTSIVDARQTPHPGLRRRCRQHPPRRHRGRRRTHLLKPTALDKPVLRKAPFARGLLFCRTLRSTPKFSAFEDFAQKPGEGGGTLPVR